MQQDFNAQKPEKSWYRKNAETDKYVLFLTSEFSQWFPSDFTDAAGRKFNCAEQYMMFRKAELFGDADSAEKILKATTPDEQKALGRGVKGFDKDIWDAKAQSIVYDGNYLKFTQNPHLFEVLMATKGKELVEAAHYDPIWGIGLRADDPLAADKANWKGTNWLGGMLTKLRDTLIADGVKPTYTEENRFTVKIYDEKGQRNLYLGAMEAGSQFAYSTPQNFAGWIMRMSKADPVWRLSLKKGDTVVTEGIGVFYLRNAEVLAQILKSPAPKPAPRPQ